MNLQKNNIAVITILFCILAYSTYTNIELKNKNDFLVSLSKNLELRKKYEGNYIWEYLNSNQMILNEFKVEKGIKGLYLFVVVDTISCYSCFKFHMTELNKTVIPIVVSGKNNVELVQASLSNSITYPFTGFKFDKKNIIVFLINDNNKIISIDFADKTNYEKSKVFYQIIKNHSQL